MLLFPIHLTCSFFQLMVIFFSLGIGPIPWLIMSEVPPLHYIFSWDSLALVETARISGQYLGVVLNIY
jgi:hypothetical protein